MILDKPFNGSNELAIDGIFVEIGGVPSSAFAKELALEMTPLGEIITNPLSETSTKGVFAAGDVTKSVLRQGIVAAAQGAIAATSAYRFVTGKKELSR
jgi:thioredoxin reductase